MDILPRLGLSKTRSRSRSPSRSSDVGGQLDLPDGVAQHAYRSPLPSPSVLRKTFSRTESGTPKGELADIAEGNQGAVENGLAAISIGGTIRDTDTSPPNPAFVAGAEVRGILVNARRPSSLDRAGSSLRSTSADGSYPTQYMHVLALPSRPKLLTSQSTDRADKLRTDPNATPSASVCDGASEAGSSVSGSMRIRFAPLPDPRRPRRYSTGRDIWLEGEEHLHLKGEVEADPDSWNEPLPGVDKLLGSFSPALEAPGSAISETFSTNSLSPGIGTSASSTLSIGRKGHKKSESISSLTSKLLNSLGIGRRKSGERSLDRTSSIESSTSARNISAWMSGGEPLSRRISTGGISSGFDSEQRGAAEFETMGVPMRRTKSTDKDQPARRAYPSVAQGGQRRQRETSANSTVEEPAFQEWTNPTAGNSITGSGTTQVEEDDGSGMAWLRKRRLEREQKAREEAKIIASAGPSVEDGESPSEAADAPHSPEIVAQIAVIPASPGFEGDKDSERPARTPGVRHNATADSGRLSPYLENDEEDENETERDSVGEPDEDLTAEEIEEEERLAEEARRTTNSAGKEVYHSHHGHTSTTYDVETGKSHSPNPSKRSSPSAAPLQRFS